MLTKHNVYSAKVMLFSDSTKGFLEYFTFRCVFYAFRGAIRLCRRAFRLRQTFSTRLYPYCFTPPRCHYGTQHQGLKPSLVPISIPCGD